MNWRIHSYIRRLLDRNWVALARFSFTAAVLLIAMAAAPLGWAQATASREYKLKVAYLYNFARYVTWPETAFESANAPFVIGILGHDPFGSSIDVLAAKKKAGQRDLVIRRIKTIDDYHPCHILYVSGTQFTAVHERLVTRAAGQPVLIVGDSQEFTSRGGTVSFYADADGTIGFAINIDAVERQGLVVQAPVLKIASVVRDAEPVSSKR